MTHVANTRLPTKQSDPKKANVSGAPIRFAIPPASSAPIGCTPMNMVAYTAITRPRNSSGTRFCIVVLVAAICEVAANPTANSTAHEIQKICDCENEINPIAQITDIAAIHFANPL